MAWTWTALPASGTANFNTTMRAALNQWKSNFESGMDSKAESDHTHGEGGVVVSIVADETVLGTGATDGEIKICADTYGNLYSWDDENSKWRVGPGNKYATGDLPAAATYTIDDGTLVYDITLDVQHTYDAGNSKWRILDGSKYPTANLPTTAYTIATGTRVFDSTLSMWKFWNASAWVIEKSQTVAKTSSGTVSVIELANDVIFTNEGAGDAVDLTLLDGAEGYGFGLYISVAQYLKATAAAGETLRYGSTQSAAAGYARENTPGRLIRFKWLAGEWVARENIGSWKIDV